MLMPTSAPATPADVQYQPKSHERPLPLPTNDSFTEDYGELSRDSRTTSGGFLFKSRNREEENLQASSRQGVFLSISLLCDLRYIDNRRYQSL